jgi:hypothetical protein
MLNLKVKPTGFNILLFLVLIVFLVVVTPLLVVWSMNTLFPVLAIPYTFDTWLAVVILSAAIRTNVTTKG